MWPINDGKLMQVWPRMRINRDGSEVPCRFAMVGLIPQGEHTSYHWVSGCGNSYQDSRAELYLNTERFGVAPFDVRCMCSLQVWRDGLWMLFPVTSLGVIADPGPLGVEVPGLCTVVCDLIGRLWPELPDHLKPFAIECALPDDKAGTPVDHAPPTAYVDGV